MMYLSRFAKMIRMIFEQSKKSAISIEEEVDFLKTYLNLEQLRFKDKVNVEININEKLKRNGFELKIPPLLLQPLIENAFKHGLFQKEEKGLIKVDFNLENNFLLCTIEDDGVGREKAKEKDQASISFLVHKMKSTLDLIGNDELRHKIGLLEKNSEDSLLQTEDIDAVTTSLNELVNELEQLLVKA
ncbi:MAG: sensor histidine kinase, partial [Flavobacteriales bacterium]